MARKLIGGSNDDIILGVVLSFFGAAISPYFGAGRFSIVAPIVIVTAVLVYRISKRSSRMPDDDQLRVLISKVRRRVQIHLADVRRSILSGQLTVAARQELSPTEFVLNKGLSPEFDKDKFVLVLGPPGLGKTLLLLELADDLLNRDSKQDQGTTPVVLSLSSWSSDFPNFKAWLMDELKREYIAPTHVADDWLERNKLILLLDGLDEQSATERELCVKAINAYLRDPGVPGIVICSRDQEYRDMGTRLEIGPPIELLKFSPRQIYAHLDGLGALGSALGQILSTNPTMLDLARTPLMLNLMMAVIDDLEMMTKELGASASKASYLGTLFDLFIRHQLVHKGKQQVRCEPVRVIQFLSWLAGKMKHDTRFFLENMQPDWLGKAGSKRHALLTLYAFSSRTTGTAVVMLCGVVLMWFSQGVAWLFSRAEALPVSPDIGLIDVEAALWTWVAITALVGGAAMGFVDLRRFYTRPPAEESQIARRADLLSICANVTFCVALFFGTSALLLPIRAAAFGSAIYGVTFGLIFWFRGRHQTISNDIRIAQRLAWSTENLAKGFALGLVAGLSFGVLVGLLTFLFVGTTAATHVLILATVSGALFGVILSGLRLSETIETTMRPNQGLRSSLKNSVLLVVYVAAPFTVMFWIYGMFVTGSFRAILQSGLFFGLVVGLLIGFTYGGLDVLYHYVLRAVLLIDGSRTLRYVPILEYSAVLDLLRRGGASYSFSHPLLQEHFARLDPQRVIDSEAPKSPKPNKAIVVSTLAA
jgi:DNA polymerase III delta prime subunit